MTRSLEEIIAALAICEDELGFHAARLGKDTRAETTDDETEHLEDLGRLYRDASRGCGVLRRYQEGRLSRIREVDTELAIDLRGVAAAVTEGE